MFVTHWLSLDNWFLKLLFKDGLEDVLEAAVILLQNRVFGGEINRKMARQTIIQTSARKAHNGLVQVIHG